MSKLVFTKNPYQEIINQLFCFGKGMHVGLIADDLQLQKRLKDSGFIINRIEADQKPAEHIRFLVVFGSYGYINRAKSIKEDRTLIICTLPYLECFVWGAKDVVILDENEIFKNSAILVAEATNLLTNLNDILMLRGRADQRLIEIREQLLDQLLLFSNPKQIINIMQSGAETLQLLGLRGITECVKEVNYKTFVGQSKQNIDFFFCYLLNLLLIRFTFFKNNGILLGADRVRIRKMLNSFNPPLKKPEYFCVLRPRDKELCLSKQELEAISLVYKRHAQDQDKCYASLGEMLNNILIAWELTNWEGISNMLISQGFVEGLLKNGIMD